MTPTSQGSFRLFQFSGIDVYVHWSWFLVAVLAYQWRVGEYTSNAWPALEYLALFGIVLLHEFGHSLACRQVGGKADQIVLWPLGGVAYVSPPQRPGATLWSIAAGPLVNVVLAPILGGLLLLAASQGWEGNLGRFIEAIFYTNLIILIFNLLPIYPLDGGQILRSLLWFVIGPGRSLYVASIIGFVGVAGLLVLALLTHSFWMGIMALFIGMNCVKGFSYGKALMAAGPVRAHRGLACPSCRTPPPEGPFWKCQQCQAQFDLFASGSCRACGASYPVVPCPSCGKTSSLMDWSVVDV